ncbi:MAG: hypothetical protein JKY34_10550 [Kordiimonadaceae bacterium]|nr:hypothetical protein [Kordiimonadaceae bacterium]
MYDQEETTKKIFGSDPTMGLFVALYLILLAFFILLNAVSNQAFQRAEAAIESVNASFNDVAKVRDPQINIDPTVELHASNNPVLKKISQAFFVEMELQGRFSSAGGGTFEVEFPADVLFQRGSFRVKAGMTGFLDQLLAAVKKPLNGEKQQVAFMFGSGIKPVDRIMTRSQEIAVRRAGSLARYLISQGVEKGVFTTGFVAIPEGQMLAVFLSAPTGNSRY